MPDTEVRVEPTRYIVTCWPEDMQDHPNADTWSITVMERGRGLWGVFMGQGEGLSRRLDIDGEWDFPDREAPDFRDRYLFPLGLALQLAREAAPKIRIMGVTALEIIELARREG